MQHFPASLVPFFRAATRPLTVLLAALITAACGGGGGSGAPSGTTSADGSLFLFLRTPETLTDFTYEGYALPRGSFQLGYSGDTSALESGSLYVVEGWPTDEFYNLPSSYNVYENPKVADVELFSNRTDIPAGRYRDTMRLYFCRDVACASLVGGSPIAIPYDLEVRPGITLSVPATSTVTVPFGTVPPPLSIRVTEPVGGTPYTDLTTLGYFNPAPSRSPSDPNTLVVTYPFQRPGTYELETLLESSVLIPSRFPYNLRKTLRINFVVTPTAALWAAYPAAGVHTSAFNDPTAQNIRMTAITQGTSGSVNYAGVSYVSNPPAAAAHPQVSSWATPAGSTDYNIVPCAGSPGAYNCLPAGTYTANINLVVTDGAGGAVPATYPVTLTITP